MPRQSFGGLMKRRHAICEAAWVMNMRTFQKRFDLNQKQVAVLATDGVEQTEVMLPVEVLQHCGATVHLVSPGGEPIRSWNKEGWSQKLTADVALEDARDVDYDGLLLPGGVINSDTLRTNVDAREFAARFLDAGKPTFVICHGAQLLIDAGRVQGRKMTSVGAIATDLKNAGAEWVDEEVVVDQGFVSSRGPGDLPAFCAKMCEELAEGVHA
jgi:protease I